VSERPRPDPAGGPWARYAAIAISLICLAAVVWWAAGQDPPELPSGGAELAALTAAIVAYAGATLLRGERAYRLLAHSGADARRADAYALIAVGFMGNTVLPARGGDAIRAYLQAPRARTTIRNVVGTMVAERLLDLILLLTVFVVLAYGVLRGIDAPSGVAVTAVVAVGIVGVAALVALVWAARARPRLRRALEWLAPLAVPTRELRGAHGARMVALTAAIWAMEGLTYLAVSGATDLSMTPVEALYIIGIASIFILVPAGPGYLGTLDAAVIFGVRAIGGSGSEAISYLLVLRFVLVVPITAVGLGLLLARYGGFGGVRRERTAGI
jgi:glycosyltransferase 2 family protein